MQNREKEIVRVTLTGTAVNVALVVLKFVAGIVGKSSAMVADAVHSLSDFLSDVIVLIFIRIAGKPRDPGHAYGHGKFETFATLIIGVLLGIAGIGLMIGGVEDVIKSLHGYVAPRPGMVALVVAIVSIAAKEWLYHYTVKAGRRLDSQAVVANAWHHRSDAISSLGTLAGVAGAMFLGERWRILDPVAAIVVSLLILKSAYDIVKPSVNELLEASLPEDEEESIKELVMGVAGIRNIHNLRTRRVGNGIVVDLHAKMDGTQSLNEAHAKATEAENAIKARFGANTIVNIHMEPAADH
ncbi:MAG: cation transporter [Bacteroidales bacterium]|nr:cation transporter [Bacteroidales bacterium]